jgi:hypothetical protein
VIIMKDPVSNRLFYRNPVKRYPPGREEEFVAAAARRLSLPRLRVGDPAATGATDQGSHVGPGEGGLNDMMVAQMDFLDDWLRCHEWLGTSLDRWAAAVEHVKVLRYGA